MAYSDVNNTGRAVQGTVKRFFADNNGSLVGGGAADVYTVTLNEGYAAYFVGFVFRCSLVAANLTATPTINVNGIGAVTIVDAGGNALAIGALELGGIYDFQYDGANMRVGGGLGGASAGGADTELQFNSAGLLGGMSEFTFDGDQLDITYTGTAYAMRFAPSGASARCTEQTITNQTSGNVNQWSIQAGCIMPVGSAVLEINQFEPTAQCYGIHIDHRGNDPGTGIGQTSLLIEHQADEGFASNPAMVVNQSGNGGVVRFLDVSARDAYPSIFLAGTGNTATEALLFIDTSGAGSGGVGTLALQVVNNAVVDFILADTQLGEFNETEDTFTGTTGTKNIDVSESTVWSASSSMAGNTVTFSFDNPPASGRAVTMTLILDGASTATINWPASVDWPGGGAEPTWSTGIDVVSFVSVDAGTTWYGFLGGLDFA